jgi:hypothetical protein
VRIARGKRVKRAQPWKTGRNDDGALRGSRNPSDALNALKPPTTPLSNEPPPTDHRRTMALEAARLLRAAPP